MKKENINMRKVFYTSFDEVNTKFGDTNIDMKKLKIIF